MSRGVRRGRSARAARQWPWHRHRQVRGGAGAPRAERLHAEEREADVEDRARGDRAVERGELRARRRRVHEGLGEPVEGHCADVAAVEAEQAGGVGAAPRGAVEQVQQQPRVRGAEAEEDAAEDGSGAQQGVQVTRRRLVEQRAALVARGGEAREGGKRHLLQRPARTAPRAPRRHRAPTRSGRGSVAAALRGRQVAGGARRGGRGGGRGGGLTGGGGAPRATPSCSRGRRPPAARAARARGGRAARPR